MSHKIKQQPVFGIQLQKQIIELNNTALMKTYLFMPHSILLHRELYAHYAWGTCIFIGELVFRGYKAFVL